MHCSTGFHDGVLWFVVADIAEPLQYSSANKAVEGLDACDVRAMHITSGEVQIGPTRARKSQEMLCVTWRGLNSLLMKSSQADVPTDHR